MDQFIKNLKHVMKDSRFSSQPKLGKASGVAPTHIGNILRKDKGLSVEILGRIAKGVGLKPWQLLLPTKQFERGIDSEFNDLLEYYLDSSPVGRETILKVAQAQSLLPGTPEDD